MAFDGMIHRVIQVTGNTFLMNKKVCALLFVCLFSISFVGCFCPFFVIFQKLLALFYAHKF